MAVATAFALVCEEHDTVRRMLRDARAAGLLAPAVADVFATLLDRHTPARNDYTVMSCPDTDHDDCACPARYVFACPALDTLLSAVRR